MANSINTNIAAYYAQANITAASNAASASVARLSSGNRIVQASDDVAALATGTSLLTTVSALRAAQTNAAQGTSLLQVADGALTQIQNILQQMKSIALQAGSGSLTNTDRGFLNQQFQALTDEINSLSKGTSFNGVNLIDGSLSTAAKVEDSITQATAAKATLNLVSLATDGDTITINGIQLTAKNTPTTALQFAIGGSTTDTIANLAAKLEELSATTTYAGTLGKATYQANGSTLTITSRTGGTLGENFRIDMSASASSMIASGKAGVGGEYGGSTVNFFATGFTSATSSVTHDTTPAAETPFKTGDVIKATIGNGVAVSLYTVESGASLTNIVNGINVNTATTGVSAVLTYDPTTALYNIQLKTNDATNAIGIHAGNNFYNGADLTHGIGGATTSKNMFTDAMAAELSTSNLIGTSAASPFVAGNKISVSVNGGAYQEITAALTANETLSTIVDKINAHANSKALGLHASLNEAGNNIVLTYSDSSGVKDIAINGGAAFFNGDTTGLTSTNGLNNNVTTIKLFASGFAANNTTVTAANAASATPFKTGDTLSVTIPGVNGGNSISLGVINGTTLVSMVEGINTSAGATQYGIHAQVVQDSNGQFNIALSVASSAAVSSISFNGGTNFFAGVTPHSLNAPTNVSYGAAVESKQLFTNAFAATLTAGDAVVAGTTTATTPFKTGDTLSVILGNGVTQQISSALIVDSTLEDIVDNINVYANTGVGTGVTATLSADGKNILLHSDNDIITVIGGANYYTTTGDVNGTVADSGLNNNEYTYKLFNSALAQTIDGGLGAAHVISDTASGANVPFIESAAIKLSINGGSDITIATTGAGATTVQELIDLINGTPAAQAAGIHAYLDTSVNNETNIALVIRGGTKLAVGTAAIAQTGANTTNIETATSITQLTTQTAAAAVVATTSSDTAVHQTTYGLTGGVDNGLGLGSTAISGTVGDSLITGLSQNSAKVTMSFPDISAAALTDAGNFNSDGSVHISVAGKTFSFVSTKVSADQIQIGGNLQETLDNAVSTINRYLNDGYATGDVAYQLNQINIARDGNNLVFSGKGLSDPTKINGTTASLISITGFTNGAPVSNGGALTNSSRSGSSTYGVDATGISNDQFSGVISGFTATYVSSNTANVSVKVGNYTYTASSINTNPTSANQNIRFYSDTLADGTNGGYFDVQLAQNQGLAISGQPGANILAQRFNAAFSSLNFAQSRVISSYNGTQSIVADNVAIGSLLGSKVSASLPNFNANKLTDITVTPPATGQADASISITIDGVKYVTKAGLGNQLGANQTYRLVSVADPKNFVDFTTGNTAIKLGTNTQAKAVQEALKQAFGTNSGAAALSFQIGATVNDTLSVSIGSATTTSLFNGEALNVSTQADAANASAVLDSAINAVTSLRATVGALGSQFNFASAAIQSSVQNQDAARGALLDTDIAVESTAYATSQVKLQAGISVLAQANQQLQALLKLIG